MKKIFRKSFLLAAAMLFAGNSWAIDKDTDGFYIISTAQDLVDFAELQNTCSTDDRQGSILNAKFTADIDMTGITNFPGIGNDNHECHRFHGTLNGQGHRIKNLVMEGSDVALIRVASDNVLIKDLIMDSSCEFKGTGRNAAFISASNWPEWTNEKKIVFENCGNEANVTGTGSNCAAFLGCNYNGGLTVVIKNCYNTGNITGSHESAILSGWFGNGNSTVTNTWNIGEVSGADGSNYFGRGIGEGNYKNCYQFSNQTTAQATSKSDALLATGEFCFLLNGDQSEIHWFQTKGTDSYPIPFSFDVHKQIYANGALKCDGTSSGGDLTYSNSNTSEIPPHTNADGFCSVCSSFIKDGIKPNANGIYEISNGKQLYWFSTYVDQVNATVNAVLTADIDYTEYQNGFIGRAEGKAYAGTFDGQEHTITVNLKSIYNHTGLFCYTHGANINNLVVDGNVTMEGHNCGGGLGGRAEGTTVNNVVVKTVITDNQNGDGTIGGFFAVTTADWKITSITNSAFYGSIKAAGRNGNGGLVGWADNGGNTHFDNCLIAPAEISWNGGGTFTRKGCTVNNCCVVLTGNYGISDTNSDKAIILESADLASGAAAFNLNGKADGIERWYQNIGTDAAPVPFLSHNKVYANGAFTCDGEPKGTVTYSDAAGSTYDEHIFNSDDLCTSCYKNGKEPAKDDDIYQIANIGQLVWFANTVNAGATEAKAVLTADIEQGDAIYSPIGNDTHIYKGEFDGQGHSIKLMLDNEEANNQGIFGVITDGVHISNLIAKGTIKGHAGVGGIAGATMGGANNTAWTRLDNCGNEANVTAMGANAGGMIGVNYNGSASFDFNNCYNTGKITGNESGAMSGWSGGGWSIMRHCWNAGMTNNGTGDFTRENGTQRVNCYHVAGTCNNTKTTEVTAEQAASGELAYMLNTPSWHQTIGTDATPVLDVTHGVVAKIGEGNLGTFCWKSQNLAIPEGVTAYTGTINEQKLMMTACNEAIAKETAVVIEGEPGYVSFMPTDTATPAASNDLIGSYEKTDAFAGMFVFANGTSGWGFYPTDGGTLRAGKAYLNLSGNPARNITMQFGNATAIKATEAAEKNTKMYDLSGRQINKANGIYIQQGKKFLSK